MKAQIEKWGNSLGIRVPKNFVNKMNLKKGSYVNMELQDNRLIISYEDTELDILINQITDNNRHSEVFNNDSFIGKEIW